jgi:BirA family biotin operon repressor/biotin-[acetyl-CoA-carboxylase] ligase
VNIALLRMLQSRPDSFFWPESLARSLKISPARLLRDLRELEAFGFGIDQEPYRGVRFAEPARRLCVDQIEWELGTRTIGRRIAVWNRVTSTNDLAARAAKSPSNDGLVVLAEEQTAGRGRRDRRWHAPPHSSILMSVLIFPPPSARSVALLTSLAAVAVADVLVASFDLPARIKWPNDVRVDGQKVCGILVEVLTRSRRSATMRRAASRDGAAARTVATNEPPTTWRAAVIGIGINANIEPHQFPSGLASPATSLMDLCCRPVDRSELARSLIQRLDDCYQRVRRGDAATLWQRWRELADLIGETVRVEMPRGELCGRLLDVDPARFVRLRAPGGAIFEFAPDEVLKIAESNAAPRRREKSARRARRSH